jgi:hypothetical protein
MKKATLTKIKDLQFSGEHPNGIDEGYTTTGILFIEPVVGKHCVVGDLRTTKVVKIIDKNTFETQNSIYKLEYHESIEPYIPR